MTTIIRTARTSAARTFTLVALVLAGTASSAMADTLMMPNRDVLAGSPVVIWGVTTRPNGTAMSIDFGDPLVANFAGNVGDRSYINFTRTYTTPGIKTVTLTVAGEAPATVEIQVFAPSGPTAAEVTRNVRINSAIADGLRYLWFSQSSRTTFDSNNFTNWGRPSFTALVVLAFENHGYRLPNDNSVPTGIYERFAVRRGLNTLANQLGTLTIGLQPAGNPCAGAAPAAEFASGGNCIGYFSAGEGIGLAGYANALMILPFSGSGALNRNNTEGGGPAAGRTYGEITQRLLNAMAFGQNEVSIFGGAGRGGWNYGFNQDRMDGSTAGWNVLAILDAQAAGIPLPSFLIPEFSFGLDNAFNDDGSFDYNTDGNPTPNPTTTQNNPTHRNMAKAGIGAQAHFLMGGLAGDARGTEIQNFINSRWPGTNASAPNDYLASCGTNLQNKGCAYAMFNVFKGLKLLGVTTLPGVGRPAGPGAIPANDWYADYQDWLVSNQAAPTSPNNGNWSMPFSCCTSSVPASTAIGELILSSVALVLPDADKFATVGLSPATATGVEGGSHTVTAKAESSGGAPVPGATVNFTIISGPNAGLTGAGVTGATGEATFTYTDQGPVGTLGTDRIRANIGTLLSNIAEMTWTPSNRAPVANPDDFTVDEDTVLNGNVVTNDTDEDGDAVTATLVSGPASGTLVFNSDGSFTYTPQVNFCGTDGFTYQLNDGTVDSNVASASITVTCVNDAPIAADSSATTSEDTPLVASVSSTDVDGGAPTYAVISGPSHGTLALNPTTGAYTYTPAADYNGPDAFTFSVDDGAGGTDSGNVSITVTPVNDAPVCTAAAPSIGSLWPANHALINVNVLGVTDPVEGSAITITITGIWQDEPTNTIGDGNTLIDGFGVGTSTAQVRAERSGAKRTPGDGRMYHIFFTGTDAEGGECTGSVKVGVPHDQGQDGTIGDGGPLYSSTGS
jgi:hypothetical protein